MHINAIELRGLTAGTGIAGRSAPEDRHPDGVRIVRRGIGTWIHAKDGGQAGAEPKSRVREDPQDSGVLFRIRHVEGDIRAVECACRGCPAAGEVRRDRHGGSPVRARASRAASAESHADDHDRAPTIRMIVIGRKNARVSDAGFKVHIRDMRVVGLREPLEVGQQLLRHEGPELGAEMRRRTGRGNSRGRRGGEVSVLNGARAGIIIRGEEASVKGMKHSVVCTDVHHRPPGTVPLIEGTVGSVSVNHVVSLAWRADCHRRRVDDVAQLPHAFRAAAIVGVLDRERPVPQPADCASAVFPP